LASKYCRIAGVLPAGSSEGESIGDDEVRSKAEYNIVIVGFAVLILSLDTTTRAGSVAVIRDHRVLVQQAGDAALTHAQRLPGDLMTATERAGIDITDVDLFAVAAGPGSFTGLRVGIATIQGLAIARGRRVVPVSTLEALALSAPEGVRRIASWMDAQRGEVFARVFERDETDLRPLTGAIAAAPELALELHGPSLDGALFFGDGAVRYRERILAARAGADVADTVPSLAAAIGLVAARRPDRAVAPHAIVPIYVRRPDAEIARDRKLQGP
jgi:tRNA threonylcarbamoyladenosine biosynthesis protein TsaB